MGEKKTTPITLDGKEYIVENMTQEQQMLLQHITDLDRKVSSAQFTLDQFNVGKQAFVNLLKQSLEAPVETAEVEVVQ
jgi:hypothetical protein